MAPRLELVRLRMVAVVMMALMLLIVRGGSSAANEMMSERESVRAVEV